MPNKQKGVISLALIFLLAVAVIITIGVWVFINQNEEQTQSTKQEKKTYTVLAVGDIACDPNNPNFNNGNGQNNMCVHKAVVEQMNKQNPDLVLLLGDIQYQSGQLQAFEQSFVPIYQGLDSRIIAVPGNHDWMSGNLDGYKKTFDTYFPNAKAHIDSQTYFKDTLGKWSIYALDSDCEYVGGCNSGSKQYEWLSSQLAEDNSLCSLGIWHHPIFTSGFHKADGGETRAVNLYDLLQKNGTEMVLNGHDHNYQRFAKKMSDGRLSADGMRSFVSGGGGAELHKLYQPLELGEDFALSEHGFVKLQLSDTNYSWEFITVDGRSLDRGQDSCRD